MINNIIVKKDLINNELPGDALTVLIALCKITNNVQRTSYIHMSTIEYVLTNDIGNRTLQKNIISGLLELKENNIIDYTEYKKQLTINTEKLYRKEKENYICIKDSELITIMTIPRIQNTVLLKYYIHLVGTINNTSKAGYTTQEYFENTLHIPRLRIIEYNKLLEDLQLLYIHRIDTAIKNIDGTIKKANNTYGRYEDKELIIKSANDYITNTTNLIKSINGAIPGDEKRSIKQRYNSILKRINKGIIPTEEEIYNMNILVDKYNIATMLSDDYEKLKPIEIKK